MRSRQKRCAIIRASCNSEVVHNQLISGMQIMVFDSEMKSNKAGQSFDGLIKGLNQTKLRCRN